MLLLLLLLLLLIMNKCSDKLPTVGDMALQQKPVRVGELPATSVLDITEFWILLLIYG
jgi:hypothetical protein